MAKIDYVFRTNIVYNIINVYVATYLHETYIYSSIFFLFQKEIFGETPCMGNVPSCVHKGTGSLESQNSVLNPMDVLSRNRTTQWPHSGRGDLRDLFKVSTVPSAQRHTEGVNVSFKPTHTGMPLSLLNINTVRCRYNATCLSLNTTCRHHIVRPGG